ncbi:hypothetical protein [Nocardiopsis sp. CC223A]|uniref:hypothetical protein n=1 Tax=Nocardiopsis sp. CC223A TaxID=3044051 RepID=UPI00278BE6FE|nr:hypothetical protein [Nocardiopsis sp. CC223A]
MRYAHGGGFTAAQRHQRELVRLKAADLFARQIPPTVVAHRLRVSRMVCPAFFGVGFLDPGAT